MIELATIIAAGSIAATFFTDILSRAVKSVTHLRRHDHQVDSQQVEAQPAN
ncbi:MAG: hypothetical protein WAU68_13870 [Vitreimonas sp.]